MQSLTQHGTQDVTFLHVLDHLKGVPFYKRALYGVLHLPEQEMSF